MLNASPNFLLASHAVRHAVAEDRHQLQVHPQRGSFENSNSARYLKNNRLSVPPRITGTVRYDVGYDKSGFLLLQMSDKQFDRKLVERQFGLHILSSLAPVSRYTWTTMPLTSLGLAAPVAAPAAWLEASLNELEECSAYALDESLEEPSELGLTKAKKLLKTLSTCVTDRPDIYPMDEGSIAIDFRNPESKSGVLFLVEQNGSGALFHRTKNSKGRLRVDDAADLLQEGVFLELERVGIR